MLSIGAHLPARVGEEQPPPDPVEEGDLVMALQFPDCHTDGGLGDVQLLRGGSGGALPAHGEKNAQVA